MRIDFRTKNIFKATGLILIQAGAVLFFQNCSSSLQAVHAQGDPEASLDLASQFKASKTSKTKKGSVKTFPSYIFSGKYGVNPADPKGNQVCEYPSLKKCFTGADGKAKGAYITQNSKLNPGARLQILKFDFQSNGFLSRNPSAHIAVGIRGKVTLDAVGDPIAINGRGFLVGTHEGGDSRNNKNPTCLNSMAQVETYHGDAFLADSSIPTNHIFPSTCTDTIFSENAWYRLELYVSRDQKIGFRVLDEKLNVIHAQVIQDPYNYLDLSLNDFFIAHVFESDVANEEGNWNYIVKNIQMSQSKAAIEDFFVNPMGAWAMGALPLANNSVVTLSQLRSPGVSFGPISEVRQRIYGCAAPQSVIESLGACLVESSFSEMSLVNSGSFALGNQRLQILADPFLAFSTNRYSLVLRLNPASPEELRLQIETGIGR